MSARGAVSVNHTGVRSLSKPDSYESAGGSSGLGWSVTGNRPFEPPMIAPMRDRNAGVTVRQRAVPRLFRDGPRPHLRCAVVIETLPLFAEGLVRLLHELADIRMISTGATFANFRTLLARLKPELVVLDLDARDSRPVDAARLVQRHASGAKLIFLSCTFSAQSVPVLLRAGASAVLLKSARPSDMRETLTRVLGGRPLLRSASAAARSGSRGALNPFDAQPLTQREREVLAYTALGFTVKRTADTLRLSPKTIESHRTRLMAKLRIHDRVMLTHYALQSGIIPELALPPDRSRAPARSLSRIAAP
jgi:DNA-binding NarL/FixJ family response regulator